MKQRFFIWTIAILLWLCVLPAVGQQRRMDLSLGFRHFGNDSVRVANLTLGLLGQTDKLRGVQINALGSAARRDMRGVQVSGVSNVANQGNGFQLTLMNNVAVTPFRGVQLSGVANISMGMKRGMQVAGVANICSSYMRGLQLGMHNYADTLSGSQVGIINVCVSHPRGVQIGLVNYSRDTVAHKIGLVNINPKTRIDLMAFGGTTTKVNVALRFRNRSTYNIIGVGTHYFGLDERFSGALFYRVGQYFRLSPRWSVSGDVGFAHVESFEENSRSKPERLYSLQLRANADYQISPHVSAFATVGYGDTRRYYHRERYRQRAIVEAGLAFRINPAKGTASDYQAQKNTLQEDETQTDSVSRFAFDYPERNQKHPWWAAVETFGINAGVQLFDRFVMDADFAQINLHTIHHNFKTGFVWDNDQFSTNLFAHPYHGGLYFNAARSNGLTFWESVPYSFCGSLMWEGLCETEPPAINDLMATTMGGVCIGEITHRINNLVYDDRRRGFRRFCQELLGAVTCPIRELNRIITGDAWRVRGKGYLYHDYDRIPVGFAVSTGYHYLADDNALFRGEGVPYVNLSLAYGDPFDEDDRKPYDYFTADLTFNLGGGQPIVSGVHLLGRLLGTRVAEGNNMKAELGLFQHFNYFDSEPVKDGTSLVPYRISEAAAVGPGVIWRFPRVGNLTRLEQRIFLDGILLGGSLSDYYNVIDRDYNMGSGYGAKVQTLMDFGRIGSFAFGADYYRIFTWKGYEDKDLTTIDPIYLNAQGDRGNAALFVLNTRFMLTLSKHFMLDMQGAYYVRDTHYKFHPNVHAKTFDLKLGLMYKF